jgi:U4/U6 small nuclear ribonucleoprotein PRP31
VDKSNRCSVHARESCILIIPSHLFFQVQRSHTSIIQRRLLEEMARELNHSFLDDLNELNDDEDDVDTTNNLNNDQDVVKHSYDELLNDFDSDEEDEENEDGDHEDVDEESHHRDNSHNLDEILRKMSKSRNFNGTSALRISDNFQNLLNQITSLLNNYDNEDNHDDDHGHDPNDPSGGVIEDDPEYHLIVSCNKTILDIDEEILLLHRYVSDIYNKKFPELESLIPNRIDYVKTILRIGNEMDMTLIELNDLLPAASVMVVSVTGSTTSGQPLSEQDLQDCFKGCHEILQLDQDKSLILQYVQSRMNRIAPNTCLLLGSRVTAQLIGLAGGVPSLSRIPACNIQVIGQEKRLMAGFSNISSIPHQGIIQYCDLVQSAPPFLRKKVLKLVASKVAISSRVDSYKHHPDGAEGRKLRNEIEEKIEKFQELPKAKTKKALPKPEEKKKSHRGGKRVRKWKERFAITEMRALQNRIGMSVTDGEYGDSAMGVDLGMLSSKGKQMGKLRAPQRKEIKINKKQKNAAAGLSSGQTNGLSSSLVFTPVQGLELVNPNAAAEKVKEANKKWFNSNSGFMSAVPKQK